MPKSRENFIKFGMGLRYNLQEINFVLQRYGKYPRLYSKSLEDAICIYIISHYPKDESINPYDEYEKIKANFLNILKTKIKESFLQIHLIVQWIWKRKLLVFLMKRNWWIL